MASRNPPDGFSLGIGALYSKAVYKGVDDNFIAIPLISFKYKNFQFRGLDLIYGLYKSATFSFNLGARPQFLSGYDADDSDFLNGMQDRKGGLEVFLSSVLSWKFLKLGGRIAREVTSKHDGSTAALYFGSGVPLNVFFKTLPFTLVNLNLGLRYRDRRHSDHFYGVQSSEELADRPFYQGEDSINPYAALTVIIKLSKKWSSQIIYNIEMLDSKLYKSPIVEERQRELLIVGLNYRLFSF